MAQFSRELLTFYSYRTCPFCHRAAIALKEAKVPYEKVEINLKQRPEWYKRDINPSNKVPAFRLPESGRNGGEIIVESLIAAEYVADLKPESKLMPVDALERAKVRFFIESSSRIVTQFNQVLKGKPENRRAEWEKGVDVLRELNMLMEKQSSAGPYFLGKDFSMADLVLIPMLDRLELIGSFFDFKLDSSDPTISRVIEWSKACRSRESYKETVATREEMVEHYEPLISKE
ncbi:Glutathione S-transferase omega-2 [Zancudomyces culisetae]|uniref:Glutathione S-transferase omega-2 n=1 Tax=Zancudomyces culisetae TaxID=1213189 RepID=A0A1R1PE45_ZANCU|nr:Glutathione S-transferase omega-2 [Zancudomyces culisetae]OMH79270.1 Glutathione S-transferase omega-2 [Zancudomyces culisetae]|eukprot:OMH78557.1 Glutathione S-transferase omega-2 [Zancudomyces culisetae]